MVGCIWLIEEIKLAKYLIKPNRYILMLVYFSLKRCRVPASTMHYYMEQYTDSPPKVIQDVKQYN